MLIGVPAETDPPETRVAATPETVKKFVALGAEVAVEHGAGLQGRRDRRRLQSAGARLVDAGRSARRRLRAEGPPADGTEIARLKNGALVSRPWTLTAIVTRSKRWRRLGVAAFAMELMPRITRAQAMDVLSSQANLAGYRAVIDAAANMAGRCR